MATALDVTNTVAEALAALNAVLSIIASLHGTGSMTTEQILAAGLAMNKANNDLYASLMASLTAKP